ncbi:MAG: cobalamin-binding protein [Sandaracinaceae bacterium]
MTALRIATLVPSATDLVAALGLADALVGVSHECDHPAAEGLPVLTASHLGTAPSRDPAEIDRAVSAAVAEGTPLYATDLEALTALAPDLVIAQDVCDVCAVNGASLRGRLPDGAHLLRLGATSLAGLERDLSAIGRATDRAAHAERVISELREALEGVKEAVANAPVRRVLGLEWGDPPFSAGHWVPELITIAGGRDVLAAPGGASRRVTGALPEAELMVFTPCGYTTDEAAAELRRLHAEGKPVGRAAARQPSWALDAVRLLSRLTPASATGAARALAGVLHPERVGPPSPADAVLVELA